MRLPLLIRRVEGHSMWPTLAPNDIVVASPLVKLRSGAVVIAQVGQREFIKRVESIDDSGVRLLGDNYYHSCDSRQFGTISKQHIKGVVLGYPRSFGAIRHSIQQT